MRSKLPDFDKEAELALADFRKEVSRWKRGPFVEGLQTLVRDDIAPEDFHYNVAPVDGAQQARSRIYYVPRDVVDDVIAQVGMKAAIAGVKKRITD